MKTVHLVKYHTINDDGIIKVFSCSTEADRFKLLLETEKNQFEAFSLIFYTEELEVYDSCEEVAEMEVDCGN